MSQAARGGLRPRLRNVRPSSPVPLADTETMGTLTVERAFDPSRVTFVDGSGSMTPNPAQEDELVDFTIDVTNDNDQDADYDLEFIDQETSTVWAQTSVSGHTANSTLTVGATMGFTPAELGISPGDYTMDAELFNVAEVQTLLLGTTLGIDRSTWATGLAGAGIGAVALSALR